VATVLAVGRGPELFLVEAPGRILARIPWAADPTAAAEHRAVLDTASLPEELVKRVRELPLDARIEAVGGRLAQALGGASGRLVEPRVTVPLESLRALLPRATPESDRDFLRALAARQLEHALRSPEEIVIALAREEERLERAVGREDRAAEAFLTVRSSLLEEYDRRWKSARDRLAEHHTWLLSRLEIETREVMPNLSAVVGPRIAARLLAAAGSRSALGRMSAPRLQVLGTRRRPSPDRGPRYGILYRAERMADVPVGRRAAYARSLAALAVIAARSDSSTRRDLRALLVARRDHRIDQLRKRRA
jgi:nucleolar protein 56